MPMPLHPLHQIDLVTGPELHHRLLPGRALPEEAAHALPLPLPGGGAHLGHLDVEDALHRLADLHLVGVARHLEGHGVERFLLLQALLRHERTEEDGAWVSHFASASCRAIRAARSNTRCPHRITWYADRCPGRSTSSHGMLRAA